MVNAKEDTSQEAKKEEGAEKGVLKEGSSLKPATIGLTNSTHLEQRLQSLDSKIKVAGADFTTQLQGLRERLEHLKTSLKTVQVELKIDTEKMNNVGERGKGKKWRYTWCSWGQTPADVRADSKLFPTVSHEGHMRKQFYQEGCEEFDAPLLLRVTLFVQVFS